ncbi:acyl-phosphate glycerol 3-phosphate acyltransferase [Shewanella mangrovi]|uniref:1-acyl-sn-glycerol-3-phosphate acyltransferase n=1 Tax=Shewanella mangrovi TaxID=1515746 RepID=A0A094JA96_9GAMM|nr:1-acylglycerol-3-phosphate O-acyltransferase [Shewanella mangrovi]KFZ36825.1 acyl-phosphate glycerol 3-phosphate acyltransferase [Shewanella mangrovi]
MLLLLRCLILALMLVLLFVCGTLYCLLRPLHRHNVYVLSRPFSWCAKLMGIELEIRHPERAHCQPCIFVANHQNNYDLFTHSNVMVPGTVTLGKRSILWIPLFGLIYWLSGNIMINRKNRATAVETLSKTAQRIRDEKLSVWIFPEGTRSRGRGILPFKSGAFHTAITAGVPLVPVVASCQGDIRLNRWRNGKVIIEVLAPIDTNKLTAADAKHLAATTHQQMAAKFTELNQQIAAAK